MVVNTHRANCENAKNPGCECSGCGGSLHGWGGWADLAVKPPAAREERRQVLRGKLRRTSAGTLGFNANNRQQSVDLARLDLAGHLWDTDPRPTPDGSRPRDFKVNESPSLDFDNARMNILADEVMTTPWNEIEGGIDALVGNKQTAREIKKGLAWHGWCSMLVALIQVIEKVNEAIGLVADVAKQALSKRFDSGIAKQLKDAVVDLVVDKVWSGLRRLLDAHFPLLGADPVRALRMLAVFACPSVEQHRRVYQHALVPLMGDAKGLVAEEVKAQVAALFTAWWRRKGPATAQ
ncbi:hypothetical protein ACN263_15415 [Micromonospora sp. WMMD729]|uniref:hypothetical protein n=1 Tax=Micromonospora sp. WMMD729 TaxID=3404127 RepID=UPI003BF468DB